MTTTNTSLREAAIRAILAEVHKGYTIDETVKRLTEPRRDLADEHDTQTCDCEMCVAADEYERRRKEETNVNEEFDFENVLCGVCSYALDDEGYCIIDTDHRGILPSGDSARDLAAEAAQLVSINRKRKQRTQTRKTPCDCPLHRLSPEDLAKRINAACDEVLAENLAEQRERGKYGPRKMREAFGAVSEPKNVSGSATASPWADTATIRTAIADLLDEGYQFKNHAKPCPWLFFHDESDEQTELRGQFTDAIIARISELQSPPHNYPRIEQRCDKHKRQLLPAYSGECVECAKERLR